MTVPLKRLLKEVVKSAAGPASYATGGFAITIGELERVTFAHVIPRTNIEAADLVRQIQYSWTGNAITVIVRQINTTTASPTAWAELPAATDISAITFDVIAKGY